MNSAKTLQIAAANEINFNINFARWEAACVEDLAWITHAFDSCNRSQRQPDVVHSSL